MIHSNPAMPHALFTSPRQEHPIHYRAPESRRPAVLATTTEVLVVLDTRGRIQYCGNRNSFLHNETELTGRPINELMPDLPLREGTPGYNIAYVRCAFANDTWQQHSVIGIDGMPMTVDVHLRAIFIERGYCLLGLLRLSPGSARPGDAPAVRAGIDVTSGAWGVATLFNAAANERNLAS